MSRSAVAEAAFREKLTELGAVLLEPEWLGSKAKHRARCSAGHDCFPKPNSVQQGQGICRVCGGNDPAAAESAFRARLTELGAELLGPYTRSLDRLHVRCAAGHDCYPRPATVAYGTGICITCAGIDPAPAEAAFRSRLADLGATLLGPYLGTNKPHHVQCKAGHDCWPRPNTLARGTGVCRICSGYDPADYEARFRKRLAKLGATPLYEKYLGAAKPHRVRCAQGHECRPRPHDVLYGGHGVCRKCAHRDWDAFYVVTSPRAVKFGVTSGDPRRRLNDHAAQGFGQVSRLVVDLPGLVAHDAEIAVRAALDLAGEKPVKGREYFDISCLALVLDVADTWLADADSAASIDGAAWRAECRKRARDSRTPAGRKTCGSCGEIFDALTARARYCSRRCMNRATERRRTHRGTR